mmetsp:Transcript_36786/g.82902  ORF Transcript_36786/g.82902 Transcript_36786/m.82902 type:complete len:222 (-) Transcript_36786:799-1464(-)
MRPVSDSEAVNARRPVPPAHPARVLLLPAVGHAITPGTGRVVSSADPARVHVAALDDEGLAARDGRGGGEGLVAPVVAGAVQALGSGQEEACRVLAADRHTPSDLAGLARRADPEEADGAENGGGGARGVAGLHARALPLLLLGVKSPHPRYGPELDDPDQRRAEDGGGRTDAGAAGEEGGGNLVVDAERLTETEGRGGEGDVELQLEADCFIPRHLEPLH